MATKIIPEDQFKGQSVDFLLSSALAAIQEEEVRQSMVYSVATAGRCLCGDEDITQGRVFEAIEELLGSSVVTNSLRRYVTELARRASEMEKPEEGSMRARNALRQSILSPEVLQN